MTSRITRPALWKASAFLLGAVLLALGALQAYRVGQIGVSIAVCLLSLGICSYVVYLSYPHVTQWILDRRPHLPWGYRLTREGLFYSLVVIVVASAAAFSGNNLLYLVFSCLLAAMLLAGFVSRLVLSGLQLDVRLPNHIFARQPLSLRVTLKNLKRLLPSFSIWIYMAPESRPPRRRGRLGRRKDSTRSGPASCLAVDPIYCPMITGAQSISTHIQATFPIRGRFRNEVFWLRTKFPFSFVERLAHLQPAREITVYPSVESSPAVEEIVSRLVAEHASLKGGESHDLYRIRPAVPGDGARLVNWKATARSGQLLVKEFTRDDHLRARIVFDSTAGEADDPHHFERAVQECAAVVWRLYELHAEIGFDSGKVSISTAGNPSAVFQILRHLSRVEPRPSGGPSAPAAARPLGTRSHPMCVVFGAKSVSNLTALQSSIESTNWPASSDCWFHPPTKMLLFGFLLLALVPGLASGQQPDLEIETVRTSITVTETIEAPSSSYVTAVGSEMLESRPGVNVDDRLRDIPGFTLFRRSSSLVAHPTTQGISLRGIGSSAAGRTLVLYDGLPVNDPFGGWVYWSRVNPDALEVIEVSRGASTSAYGDRAMGGAVSLFTRIPEARRMWIAAEGGSAGIAETRGGYSNLFGKFGVSAFVRGLRSEGYWVVDENLRGSTDRKADVDFLVGDLRLDYFGDKNRITFKTNAVAEQRQNGTRFRENSSSIGTTGAHFQRGGLAATAYHSRGVLRSSFSFVNGTRSFERVTLLQRVVSEDTGGALVWNRGWKNANLIVGADTHRAEGVSRDTVTATGFIRRPGGRLWQQGTFVQTDFAVGPRTRVYGGLRHDFSDRGNSFWSPRGGVAFSEGPRRWRASAYRSFRSPTLNEFFRQFRVGNTTTLGNNGLIPERMVGVDAGFDWRLPSVLLRTTVFYQEIEDLIGNLTLSLGPLPVRQRSNLGRAVGRGVELELQKTVRRVRFEGAYLYVSSQLNSVWMPQTPRHQGSFQILYSTEKTLLSAGIRSSALQFEDDLNRFILPGFATVQFMAKQRLAHGISGVLAIENAFDRTFLVGFSPTPTIGTPRLVRVGLVWESGS